MSCQSKTMASHRLCNHVTYVLDAPLSVLSDPSSLCSISYEIYNLPLVITGRLQYNGLLSKTMISQRLHVCNHVTYVLDVHLAVLPDSFKYEFNI